MASQQQQQHPQSQATREQKKEKIRQLIAHINQRFVQVEMCEELQDTLLDLYTQNYQKTHPMYQTMGIPDDVVREYMKEHVCNRNHWPSTVIIMDSQKGKVAACTILKDLGYHPKKEDLTLHSHPSLALKQSIEFELYAKYFNRIKNMDTFKKVDEDEDDLQGNLQPGQILSYPLTCVAQEYQKFNLGGIILHQGVQYALLNGYKYGQALIHNIASAKISERFSHPLTEKVDLRDKPVEGKLIFKDNHHGIMACEGDYTQKDFAKKFFSMPFFGEIKLKKSSMSAIQPKL